MKKEKLVDSMRAALAESTQMLYSNNEGLKSEEVSVQEEGKMEDQVEQNSKQPPSNSNQDSSMQDESEGAFLAPQDEQEEMDDLMDAGVL